MVAAKKAPTAEELAAFESEVWGTEGWRPVPGSEMTGTITALSGGESEYGAYPIVTIRTPVGEEIALHCFHSVLRRELNRIRPKVGHGLTVKYHGATGEGKGKYNKGYEAYTVSSPEYVFDWDMFGNKPKPPVSDDSDSYPEP